MRPIRLLAAVVVVGAGAIGAGTATASTGTPPAVRELRGTVRLAPGACHHGRPTGSYLAVTFGTRAIKNSSSGCDGGAITLLRPRGGVVTGHYATAVSGVFDGRTLSLGATPESRFAPPRVYLVGTQINSDLRSVQAGYDGGQWSVGAERATGQYDPASRRLSMQWFSGQSFTRSSAGTEVHLAGSFSGTIRRVPEGATVNLGTASFAAGASTPVVQTAAQQTAHTTGPKRHSRNRHGTKVRLAAHSKSTTAGSPKAFLLAEVLVLLNLVAFASLSRRRGRK